MLFMYAMPGFWLDMRIVHRTAMQTLSYLFSKIIVIEDLSDMSLRTGMDRAQERT